MDNLNKNFHVYSKYYDLELHVFNELKGTIFEINNSIILGFNRAAITLTNNLLERLLKLTLIYNEVGIGPKPPENWGAIFEGPHRKFTSISLGNSIEICRKNDLISETEKIFLFDTIRELMRNGFSHADSTKILNNIPDQTTMIQGSLSNPTEMKNITINQKIIPFIQAVYIENFAKLNALKYFDYVYELIIKIERRLIDKGEKTSI